MERTKGKKEMADRLSFRDFLTVDYTPGMPDLISYRAKKRKTGMVGESLRKDIATNSSNFPEGSTVTRKKDGKTGRVMTAGKDFVKVAYGNRMVDHKPHEIVREEVNQIDELSKKTLGSYIKKASDDAQRKSNNAHSMFKRRGFANAAFAKNMADKASEKRRKGIATATDKLTKEEVEIDEALSIAQRRKKSIQFKRIAPRVKIARDRAMRRTADLDHLKKRARKAARKKLFTKLAKGASKDELSFARRQEIEKRLDKMKSRIDRLAVKELPKTRQLERDRKRPKKDEEKKG